MKLFKNPFLFSVLFLGINFLQAENVKGLDTLNSFNRIWKLTKKGFLDGERGILLAGTTSFYTFLKYAQLWILNQSNVRSGTRC